MSSFPFYRGFKLLYLSCRKQRKESQKKDMPRRKSLIWITYRVLTGHWQQGEKFESWLSPSCPRRNSWEKYKDTVSQLWGENFKRPRLQWHWRPGLHRSMSLACSIWPQSLGALSERALGPTGPRKCWALQRMAEFPSSCHQNCKRSST